MDACGTKLFGIIYSLSSPPSLMFINLLIGASLAQEAILCLVRTIVRTHPPIHFCALGGAYSTGMGSLATSERTQVSLSFRVYGASSP